MSARYPIPGDEAIVNAFREFLSSYDKRTNHWERLFSARCLDMRTEDHSVLSCRDEHGFIAGDVDYFMRIDDAKDTHSTRRVDPISLIRDFTRGADTILAKSRDPRTIQQQQPPSQGRPPDVWFEESGSTSQGGRVSSTYNEITSNPNRLIQILSTKRHMATEKKGEIADNRRLLFAADPDGPVILAIIKTAPESQRRILQQLLSGYVDISPSPVIGFTVSESLRRTNATFGMIFHIPFFTFGEIAEEDTRKLSDKNRPLRKRYLLPSLRSFLDEIEGTERRQDEMFLYEAQFSCAITGRSDQFWTCYCLADEYFNTESRIEEPADPGNGGDPIILAAGMKGVADPRRYGLQALVGNFVLALKAESDIAKQLNHEILQYKETDDSNMRHSTSRMMAEPTLLLRRSKESAWIEEIRGLLQKLLDSVTNKRSQLRNFLKHEVQLLANGAPDGTWFWDLGGDVVVKNNLRRLREFQDDYTNLETRIRQMQALCSNSLNEYKKYHLEASDAAVAAHQAIARNGIFLSLIHLILAALSFVAGLYNIPKDVTRLPDSFRVFMVLLFALAALFIGAYFFWAGVWKVSVMGPIRAIWYRALRKGA